jgi:uncharacterized protein
MGITSLLVTRTGYRLLTAAALALAAAGAVLPLLPTTPFLLVAAWSAARHSPTLERKLLSHPTFGPPLQAWRAERALSRRTKRAALAALAVSLLITLILTESLAVQLLAGMAVASVAAFLGTRPEPGCGPGNRREHRRGG